MLFIFLSFLSLLFLCRAAIDSVHVTLYPNGEHRNGKPFEITRASMADLDAWKAHLNTIQPVLKRHMAPGEAAVGSVYTQGGEEITRFDDIDDNADLYLVAEGLLFVWPFVHVGYNITVKTGLVSRAEGIEHNVILEAVNELPRVFLLHHFFSNTEADLLVENIQKISDPEYKLKRSTTGVHTGKKAVLSTTRTSENAFDSGTPEAMAIKHRAFELLRLREYDERLADGLQLLKYQQKQAYIPHHDWFDDGADRKFNFDPAKGGSNRFATVFLYLSDVDLGGQTVFPRASRPSKDTGLGGIEYGDMPSIANELFAEGSWELDTVQKCYSKLAFKPRKATAILFYSQTGDGGLDGMSLHGACPVLQGTKWGANLWVWNNIRHGLPSSPVKEGAPSNDVTATFVNDFESAVTLRWSTTDMGVMEPGKSLSFNSFHGHEWSAVLGETTVWEHTIDVSQGDVQALHISESPVVLTGVHDEL